MFCGQLSRSHSLQGTDTDLATQETKLYHMETKAAHRLMSTYANKYRSHDLFKIIFFNMLSSIGVVSPEHKFKTTKGAIKLHVKLNHAGFISTFAIVTTGKLHEQQ